jgi:SAM-dependent methyltransferase
MISVEEHLEREGIVPMTYDEAVSVLDEKFKEEWEELSRQHSYTRRPESARAYYNFIAQKSLKGNGQRFVDLLFSTGYLNIILTLPVASERMRGRRKIIDIGCGTGLRTRYIAKNNPHAKVLGIDISDKMLELARERSEGIPNLSFQEGNMMDVGGLPTDFDCAFYSSVLAEMAHVTVGYMMGTYDDCLLDCKFRQTGRILRPRGLLLATEQTDLQWFKSDIEQGLDKAGCFTKTRVSEVPGSPYEWEGAKKHSIIAEAERA